ncbi:uncharacterized protein LOC106635841 isoform X3 [Copidosoma floridanum]|uniref:uncharacterized protein LOC106635841 isoform X3 n=1 Tax=Copidosoma floridanum TaxID=29053 RepID=UPI0006C9D85A|nr:uncharacterized protein LOC106635841 isoform X3 [Copidosoma floridanum]
MSSNVVMIILFASVLRLFNEMRGCSAALVRDGDSYYVNCGNDDGKTARNGDKLKTKSRPKSTVGASTTPKLTSAQIDARSRFHPCDPRFSKPECWFDPRDCLPFGYKDSGIQAARRCKHNEVWIRAFT